MIEFKLPSLGSDMDEGRLNDWRVHAGDTVARGQIVAEVETTKAAIEVECWHDGTVYELLVQPGTTVPVGTVLATLLEPGETAPPTPPDGTRARPAPPAQRTPPPTPPTARPAEAPTAPPARRRWVSPAARRTAEARGVDLDLVTGTGPGGAVTIADVDRTAESPPPKEPSVDRAAGIRQTIAAAMSRSNREIPHYYLTETIPLDTTLAWLEEHNRQRRITERVLLAVLQIRAVALAARRYPELNGFWIDGTHHSSSDVHVGVAVSLRQGGLIAPALHDVPDKPIEVLMAEFADLVSRARAGRLRSSEVSDPTLTVTNLGDRGVESVLGVIYPPQVALVGFGRTTTRSWPIGDELRAMPTVVATLAADHRASDGHRGGLFLADIHARLTHPESLWT